MANSILTKTEIETIFNRLRSIPTNKSCFDCGAKNPTWASVTYGVFICIDCSAVHRGLGVHLTFVRSTNLDTNWTWIQIRQMQLSGNANAAQFFRQHNCNTTDAQQKYNSRAAQLYRDKLVNSAHQAMKLHGNALHIDTAHENVNTIADKKEEDFFAECTNDDFLNNKINNSKTLIDDAKKEDNTKAVNTSLKDDTISKGAPNVDFFNTSMPTEPIKSTIGVRKIVPRKTGLGAKKAGGLGATKVKTNFADIEHKANLADQIKETIPEKKLTCEEEADAIANVRLAYQDLSLKQNKEEEKLKAKDPTKAKQMERLGMGFNFNNAKGGVSHSALTDMHTIAQETAPKSNSKQFDRDSFDLFADYDTNMYSDTTNTSTKADSELIMMGFETIETMDSRQNIKSMFSSNNKSISDQPTSYNRSTNNTNHNRTGSGSGSGAGASSRLTPSPYKTYENDAAQKKFGGAKAISSDQYFGNNSNNGDGSITSPTSSSSFEQSTNLARFQGSNSISSSDYFGESSNNRSRGGTGGGSGIKNYSMEFQGPHMDDVKKSVREGVTKVADRLSNLASDVMSSIQDKYGY